VSTAPTPDSRAPERAATPIDAVADAYVTTLATLNPFEATELGIPGHDHEVTDLSPAGHEARAEAARATLRALDGLAPADEVDEVTLAAMRERLGLDVELHESGEVLADLNVIASPVQGLRDVFDIMSTDGPDAWSAIAQRLAGLPSAGAGYVESLRLAASKGRVPAVRQVREALAQAEELADPSTSFFTGFVTGPEAKAAVEAAGDGLRADLERGADDATAAEQGNRDEDRMEAETAEQELPER
jgi:uncharacterized protein (DUF885 family)